MRKSGGHSPPDNLRNRSIFHKVKEGLEAGRLRPEAQTPQQRGTERKRPAAVGDFVPPDNDQSERAAVARRRLVCWRHSAPAPTAAMAVAVQRLAHATAVGTVRSRRASSVDSRSTVPGQPELTTSHGVT